MPLTGIGKPRSRRSIEVKLHSKKKEVIVYDYTDDALPMLAAMFSRGLKGYESRWIFGGG
jgi:hypothetical protein